MRDRKREGYVLKKAKGIKFEIQNRKREREKEQFNIAFQHLLGAFFFWFTSHTFID